MDALAMVEKNGELRKHFPGKFSIWREIVLFYMKHLQKTVGSLACFPGRKYLFQLWSLLKGNFFAITYS